MDANPFRTARSYLAPTPIPRWGAVASSTLSAVLLALLFPLLYLFVDLLVWQGRVPSFDELPAGRQAAFRAEWDGGGKDDPATADALARVRNPDRLSQVSDGAEWEFRWRAATYARLTTLVSPHAAESYLPLADAAGQPTVAPTGQRLGLLSLVARERGRWPGGTAAGLARWNRWAWEPGASGSANVSYLTGLFLLGFGLLLARGLMVTTAAHWASAATLDAATRLRRAVFGHSFRLANVATHQDAQDEAGELLARRAEQVREGLAADLTGGVRGPVTVVLLAAVLLAVHPWLAAALLLLAAVVWLVAGQAAAYFRRDARRAGRRAEVRLGQMTESMQVMQLVKAYLMERFGQARFERQLADLNRSVRRRERGEAFSRPALIAVVALAGVVMLYVAGRAVLAGQLSAAGLAVMAAATAGLVYAVNRWVATRVRVRRAREAAADLLEFLDRRADVAQPIDAEFMQPIAKQVEVHDVAVREAGSGRMILDGVKLTIPAGSRTAVVAVDPAEGLTLAHVLTKFAETTAGEVKVDGKNLRWLTAESVRTQVALVSDQALTFTDTVANNIGCGEPSFTLPQIIEAAKTAHAHQFVQRLPYGYETLIGTGGVMLRPGERFRIALARAALRDPSLVIIEEPSEPLDADSLVLIDDALKRLEAGRTLLFLARRPSTVKAADRVYVLQHGRVVAAGTHDELFADSDLYRVLHYRQSLATT